MKIPNKNQDSKFLSNPSFFGSSGNILPKDIRNELKTVIKGKSVLILTEIASQPLERSNSVYLSYILDIPRQTVSDELKRLIELRYLDHAISNTTLIDVRYKFYTLTEKGILFLQLLKDSINNSLNKVNKDN